MIDLATRLANRLADVDWNPEATDARLRVSLMREYLRRSALWAAELRCSDWPFFDIAALVDPRVRAPEELVERVRFITGIQHLNVQRTCEWALHFASLTQSQQAQQGLPDPFEPLISLYEHGGGFTLDGTGMIDIDISASMSRGRYEDWLVAAPVALPDGTPKSS